MLCFVFSLSLSLTLEAAYIQCIMQILSFLLQSFCNYLVLLVCDFCYPLQEQVRNTSVHVYYQALWKKVKDNTYCTKNQNWRNSKGPRDCQARCNKMGNNCKGISISYKSISTQWCYACKDEKSFSRAANQFHYYRKEACELFLKGWAF